MQINPGGRLSVDQIVGRDEHIDRYWGVLQRQSLILSAERRIGKTAIATKMLLEPRVGFKVFYQDLEGVHTPYELIRGTYIALKDILPAHVRVWRRSLNGVASFLPGKVQDTDLSRVAGAWPSLLENCIDDIANHSDPGSLTVLVWDEFPLMLHNFIYRGGQSSEEGLVNAAKLLDLLRMLRQKHVDTIRFVFTGSVGLHLIVRQLRDAGHVNDSLNDVQREIVPPLTDENTRYLAGQLLENVPHKPEDAEEIVSRIVSSVGGFPYYVHHVADVLHQSGKSITPSDVSAAIDQLVFADHDPANFENYKERIKNYYGAAADLAVALLDRIAVNDNPVSLSNLRQCETALAMGATDESIDRCLRMMREDNYLDRGRTASGETEYKFRWVLVARWWRENMQ